MPLFRARNPAAPAGGAPRQARLPARSVWKSLGIDLPADEELGIDLQADAPVCGFVVKLKRMAAGRFYEFFVDDARLCVNVKAALVLNVLKALKLNDEVCRSTCSADPPATE